MTADRFLPVADDEPDGHSGLRRTLAVLVILLFSVFLFEVLDGVERAAEQAERHENAVRSACSDPAWSYASGIEEAEISDLFEAEAAAANTGAPVAYADDPPATAAAPLPPHVTPVQFTPPTPPRP